MSSDAIFDASQTSAKRLGVMDLRMPADRTALSTITTPIISKLSQLQVPEEKQLEILLAVQEALANAVIHGCKDDPSKEVSCQMQWHTDGRILIVVADPGEGFVPELISNPEDPENIYDDHGRGVHLILQLMDEVFFARDGREIRMWKY
jgi:serine/threonine-protein kinase RsbW